MVERLEEFNDQFCEINQIDTELERYKEIILEKEEEKNKRIKKVNRVLFLLKQSDLLQMKNDIVQKYEKNESQKLCEYIEKIERKEELDYNELEKFRFCTRQILEEKKQEEAKSAFDKLRGWVNGLF